MLGPDGPHLLVGRKFTAVSGGLGAGNRLALVVRKNDRRKTIGACKLHDGSRDVIVVDTPAIQGFTGSDVTSDLMRSASDRVTGL